MKTIYVADLKSGEQVDGETFVIAKSEKKQDKNNNDYYSLELADKTGRIPAKIWSQNLPGIDKDALKEGRVVVIEAMVDSYRGNLQLKIYKLSQVDESSLDEYLESSTFDADEMFQTLMSEIEKISDKGIKKVLQKMFEDKEIARRFKYWPAASSIHHEFRSGLIQHVLEMLTISKSLKVYYPEANFDILTAGIILHDIGKLYELDASGIVASYTKEGLLKGHITIGLEMFEKYGGRDLPEDTYLHIAHLILSHHGTKEFGSPVVPLTVEAFMLTHIDNLSAKPRTAQKFTSQGIEEDGFSGFIHWFGESRRLWNGGDTRMTDDDEDNTNQLILD
jgi:3'-5' exoribonuclease